MSNGAYPPDFTSPVSVVRLLVPDMTTDTGDNLGDYLFSDAMILALLGLYSQNAKRAAARAIEILATDQALLTKVIRTDDLSVNGAALADSLLRQAKALKIEADSDDALAADDGFTVVFGETPWYLGALSDPAPEIPEASAYPWL